MRGKAFFSLFLLSALFIPRPVARPASLPGMFKSIQTGTIAIETSTTATITAVDTAYSAVVFQGCSIDEASVTLQYYATARFVLTNSTTVTGTRASSAQAVICAYTVVEFWPAMVKTRQTGTVAMSTAEASDTATLSTAVTTSTSQLYFGGCETGADSGSGSRMTEVFGRTILTNTTTVTANRGATDDTTMDCSFTVIESY